MAYFPEQDSIARAFPDQAEKVLQTIVNRYIGEHPPHPPVYRASNRNGFKRDHDFRYILDMRARFPDIRNGQVVYAWAKWWANQPTTVPLSVSCFGPVAVFVNGERVFKSNLLDEVYPERKTGFRVKMAQGWNHIVLRFRCTPTGCGGTFGTGSFKGLPLHVIAPSMERHGQEGWIYTAPLDEEVEFVPEEGMREQDTGWHWYPEPEWSPEDRKRGVWERLFDAQPGRIAYAWSRMESLALLQRAEAVWRGKHQGGLTIWFGDERVYESADSGEFAIPLPVGIGSTRVLVRSVCTGSPWSFEPDELPEGYRFTLPVPVEGAKDAWLYLGPVSRDFAEAPGSICRMERLFPAEQDTESTYWRLDQPGLWIRPFVETSLFGKWNYPLGVTLYGILQTGRKLGRDDYVHYALEHIELCTSFYDYAVWDRQQYGGAGINHQLSAIDSLDDCGSFAATTLEALQLRPLEGARQTLDRVARYISTEQARLPDGTLYREVGHTELMNGTMWCDDLYMSTPFLCKYYRLTKDPSYLDDAACQFLLYKRYCYMPELQIMSHVYDLKFGKPTGIPWGRGNGWVLFSLAELLEIMPEQHEQRGELLAFYRALCEGYLRLQGTNGLWHQVLTDPESYEETSCTSMFLYAFAKGIRHGWLLDTEPYVQAVLKGWEGLTRIAIDKFGNVYGVCRGSGYSFSPTYYRDELSWNLNDTHGIGIVLLAGTELLAMRQHLGR